jgi:hypothetical protein
LPSEWSPDLLAADIKQVRERVASQGEEASPHQKIILAASPKSGSTYAARIIAAALGYDIHQEICHQMPFTAKDITLGGIYRKRGEPTVSQLHIFATGANLELIAAFRMRVLVLVRHVEDVIVSLRDHMRSIEYFANIIPPRVLASMSEEARTNYIIDTATPWLLTFYYSWKTAVADGRVEAPFLRYEDMIEDPRSFFNTALAELGGADEQAVDRALERVKKEPETRFNIGKADRGKTELKKAQRDRIRSHAEHYKFMDLSDLGLER